MHRDGDLHPLQARDRDGAARQLHVDERGPLRAVGRSHRACRGQQGDEGEHGGNRRSRHAHVSLQES